MEYYMDMIKVLHMQLEIVKKGFILAVKEIVQPMAEDIKNVDLINKGASDVRAACEAYDLLVDDIKDRLDDTERKLHELEQ